MKILNASQIQEADAYTIKHEPIHSLDLMERASIQVLKVLKNLPITAPYHIVCGSGNNAGDGLVIARYLHQMGEDVTVYVPAFIEKGSRDFEANLKRFRKVSDNVIQVEELPVLTSGTLIDAVFGTGLNRRLEGSFRILVASINACRIPVVAIDVPSGLMIDSETCSSEDIIVKASYTLTFMQPKLAFFFPSTGRFVGKFITIDIGWHSEATDGLDASTRYVTAEMVQTLIHARSSFYYKQMAGHALLVGGSKTMPGAIMLSAKACMRMGAGLTTVHTAAAHLSSMAAQLPDVMWQPDDHTDMITHVALSNKIDVVSVGPGMGTSPESALALKRLIQDASHLTLDADALNVLADNRTWLAFLPKGTVVTPHPGEMKRLLNTNEYSLEDVKAFAVKFNLIIVLKGAFSFTIAPDGCVFVNSSGTPALSVAGSGDVLTGMITGLRAQGVPPVQASIVANYIHGNAARLAANDLGMNSVTASDVIDRIGTAYSAV